MTPETLHTLSLTFDALMALIVVASMTPLFLRLVVRPVPDCNEQ